MTATFQIGTTYTTRSACDHECVFAWTVVARTAKQLTLEDRYGEVSKRGVSVWNGVETCLPNGRYSMAPVISADRAEA